MELFQTSAWECTFSALTLQEIPVPAALCQEMRLHGAHLLLDVSCVLLHELGEADVIGAEAAETVQDTCLAGVQEW